MKKFNLSKILLLFLLLLTFYSSGQQYVASENTSLYFPLLKGKNIAVVANVASIMNGVNIVDTLLHSGFKVKKIFSPEHGFRIPAEAGQEISSQTDPVTGLPVISLYGKKKKPEPADLKNIDIVVFDLQDVGVRFFTYLSTLTYLMEACAAGKVPLMVLDRGNPNVFYIDGPVLEPSQASFVGLHPVPIVYGMTIGEYAMMVNGEKWLTDSLSCNLTVIPMNNFTHQTQYQKLDAPPSPNLRNLNAIHLYPSLCLFEGTIMSVGRGTDFPFEVYGYPGMYGFQFSFRPLPGQLSTNPKYNGELCQGEDLRQFYNIHPQLYGQINLLWLYTAYRSFGSKADFFNDYFDKLAGTTTLRQQILENKSEAEIRKSWQAEQDRFKKIRVKYLI